MKYHPLTDMIRILIDCEIPTGDIDNRIRQWLKDRVFDCANYSNTDSINEVLYLTEEQTLEEKFEEFMHGGYVGIKSSGTLAKIAEEHYKKEN